MPTAFLAAAVGYYESLGVQVARVMTDNGSGYRSKAFRDLCRDLGLRPHPHQTRRQAAQELDELAPRQATAQHHRARGVQPARLQPFLPRSIPSVAMAIPCSFHGMRR